MLFMGDAREKTAGRLCEIDEKTHHDLVDIMIDSLANAAYN